MEVATRYSHLLIGLTLNSQLEELTSSQIVVYIYLQ